MERILEDIYCIEGLRVSKVYVIVGNDGLTLIDSGMPNSLPHIAKELQSIGHQIGEIKRILITHAHYDHIGSVSALVAASGAEVYAHHRYESEVIRGEKKPLRPPVSELYGINKFIGSRFKDQPNEPTRVDHEFKGGDHLDVVLPGLEVFDTPGHSPGHSCFWQPQQRLLFAGDAIVRLFLKLQPPMPVFCSDIEEARRSVHRIAELDVETLCMGHGKPIRHHAAPLIRKLASKL